KVNQGLRDLNSARQNITERYLRKCDEIFVVCPIGRAITDEGVLRVCELARQAKLSNVSIICTRSDVSHLSVGILLCGIENEAYMPPHPGNSRRRGAKRLRGHSVQGNPEVEPPSGH